MSFNEGVSIDTSRASRGRGGRGGRAGGIAAGGGVGGLLLVLLFVVLGGDPSQLPGTTGGGGGGQEQGAGDLSRCQDAQDANTDVECRIIATENSLDAYWQEALPAAGGSYERPYTVVFEGQTDTGCGAATSAVGPFYCPTDQLDVLRRRLLRGAHRPVRLQRQARSRRSTSSRTSSATTCRTCSACSVPPSRTRAARSPAPSASS